MFPLPTKQMQLGVKNQIVDDSDFKPANFDRQFWSDSDFNNEIESMIAFRSNFDQILIKIEDFNLFFN